VKTLMIQHMVVSCCSAACCFSVGVLQFTGIFRSIKTTKSTQHKLCFNMFLYVGELGR